MDPGVLCDPDGLPDQDFWMARVLCTTWSVHSLRVESFTGWHFRGFCHFWLFAKVRYPRNRTFEVNCYWSINTEKSTKIRIEMREFSQNVLRFLESIISAKVNPVKVNPVNLSTLLKETLLSIRNTSHMKNNGAVWRGFIGCCASHHPPINLR